jgi:hypothetical protein
VSNTSARLLPRPTCEAHVQEEKTNSIALVTGGEILEIATMVNLGHACQAINQDRK